MTCSNIRSHQCYRVSAGEVVWSRELGRTMGANNRYDRQRTVTSQEADEARALHALGRLLHADAAASPRSGHDLGRPPAGFHPSEHRVSR
jgi:hypothetical protein